VPTLFACGLATLVQSIGFPASHSLPPVMMVGSFARWGPMLSMRPRPMSDCLEFTAGYCRLHLALLVCPFMSRLLASFPPVVTGQPSSLSSHLLDASRRSIWAGGGLPTLTRVVEGCRAPPNPGIWPLQGRAVRCSFVRRHPRASSDGHTVLSATRRFCSALWRVPSFPLFSARFISKKSCPRPGSTLSAPLHFGMPNSDRV